MKQLILDAPDAVGLWVSKKLGVVWVPGSASAIGLIQDRRLIAGTLYYQSNGISCWMACAGDGKEWLNKAFLRSCFVYPFEQLGLKKLIASVDEANETSQRFVRALGFRLEATLSDACPGGSLLIYSMVKADCRWLNIKVNLNVQGRLSDSS